MYFNNKNLFKRIQMKKILAIIIATVINGFAATEGYYPSVSSHETQSSHISTQVHQQVTGSEKTKRYYVGLVGTRLHILSAISDTLYHYGKILKDSSEGSVKKGLSSNDAAIPTGALLAVVTAANFVHGYFSWQADKAWREKYKQPNYKSSKLHTTLCFVFAPIYGFFHWLGE